MDGAVSDSETSRCDTLEQGEGRCHFRVSHKVSLQVEGTGVGGDLRWEWLRCARFLCELKMLPFFVVHSKEANYAQDLAALAGLCWCSKDKTWDAVCGTGIQGKKLFAVRTEYKQAERPSS